jgi:hypothetical protein
MRIGSRLYLLALDPVSDQEQKVQPMIDRLAILGVAAGLAFHVGKVFLAMHEQITWDQIN